MAYVSIMEPAGPVIAVHKGWYRPPKQENSKSEPLTIGGCHQTLRIVERAKHRPLKKAVTQRQYEFVNVTRPERTKDADMRKLVRTHVRNDYLRDKTRKGASHLLPSLPPTSKIPGQFLVEADSTGEKTSLVEAERSKQGQGNVNAPDLLGFPTALCTSEYAIDMQPRMHALLSRYLTFAGQRTYSGRVRQGKTMGWLRLSAGDPAMLHGMLYSAAICLALLEGRTESQDSIYHLYQTISVVNKRLETSTQNIEESTIAALSCLALGEAITGNKEAWNIHMRGLKRILCIKTEKQLNPTFIAKLHRTDIAGAIDYSERPHLGFARLGSPTVWSILPEHDLQQAAREVTRILSGCQLSPGLIDIMIDVAHFSRVVSSWRSDPSVNLVLKELVDAMYWIEYRLLLFPTTLEGLQRRGIDEACRIGALLYMKALLEEFPHSATGPWVLLNQLQDSLQRVAMVDFLSPLLVWLSLIGAALSKSEMRDWFMSLLQQLSIDFRITSFRDQDLEISRKISLEEVLGISLEKIRTEVKERFRHVRQHFKSDLTPSQGMIS